MQILHTKKYKIKKRYFFQDPLPPYGRPWPYTNLFRTKILFLWHSQHFIEPENSLPCSQESSTGPYPKPDQCSPYQPILSRLRFTFTLSTHLCFGLPSGLFPSGFPTNILHAFFFSSIRSMCLSHLILFDLSF
jgi:hypothetical protein